MACESIWLTFQPMVQPLLAQYWYHAIGVWLCQRQSHRGQVLWPWSGEGIFTLTLTP